MRGEGGLVAGTLVLAVSLCAVHAAAQEGGAAPVQRERSAEGASDPEPGATEETPAASAPVDAAAVSDDPPAGTPAADSAGAGTTTASSPDATGVASAPDVGTSIAAARPQSEAEGAEDPGVGILLAIDATSRLDVHVSTRPFERGARLCFAPCRTRVARGNYYFGVAHGLDARMDETARAITGPVRMHVEYGDRSAIRTVGGVILGVAIAAAITSIVGVVVETDPQAELAYVTVGAIGGSLFVGLSLPFLFVNDSLRIQLEPASAAR